MGAASINLRLSAIRKLAGEANALGQLDLVTAMGIAGLKGEKQRGARMRRWLTQEQAQALLSLPDASTVRGARDRVILAALLGPGLRRSEIAALTFAHIQQREGRWALVDLQGKGRRIHSVPVAAWLKSAIDAWAQPAGITSGAVFRPTRRGGHVYGEAISDQTIYDMVALYSARLGVAMSVPLRRDRKRPKTRDDRTLSRYERRWQIERLFAQLENVRRLMVRSERRHTLSYLGRVHLGCILIPLGPGGWANLSSHEGESHAALSLQQLHRHPSAPRGGVDRPHRLPAGGVVGTGDPRGPADLTRTCRPGDNPARPPCLLRPRDPGAVSDHGLG
jgi:transposase